MSIPISVDGNTIISANEIDAIGVTLDDKLKFNFHFQSLCFRAPRPINSFERIAKYLNVERRLAIFKSFILSNFSYIVRQLGYFVGRRIVLNLKNYKNVPFA